MQDTFLDAEHVKESFPGSQVALQNGTGADGEPKRPFKVTFPLAPAEPQAQSKVEHHLSHSEKARLSGKALCLFPESKKSRPSEKALRLCVTWHALRSHGMRRLGS